MAEDIKLVLKLADEFSATINKFKADLKAMESAGTGSAAMVSKGFDGMAASA